MQTVVGHLEELQQASKSPGRSDRIAEHNDALALLLLQIIIKRQVLVFRLATSHKLAQGLWHHRKSLGLLVLLSRQIDNLWIFGPEL